MDNINGGYVALGVVGIFFFALQIWWISLVVSNGSDERVLRDQFEVEAMKKRLEKIFSRSG